MSAAWIVGGLSLVIVIVALIRAWSRRDADSELGAVSHQWIAEQRFGQGHDSQR